MFGSAPQGLPLAVQRAILTAISSTGGAIFNTNLHLCAANVPINNLTPISALTEPTFTGYSPATAIAWGSPANGPGATSYIESPSVLFRCTGGTPTDIIYGWFLTDSTNTQLVMGANLLTPVAIAAVDDAVLIQPVFTFSGQ